LRLLTELQALLHDEAAILNRNDADGIRHIGSTRQRCVDALTRLDVERADTCRMLSFGQGGGALNRLYQWCDASGALNSKWLANLTVARQCQQLNDTNGAVVTAKLSRVQQLLMVIRGTSAPPVYSARASRYGVLGTRDLGLA
jgi:flagellar biosynthesis/type III secretory pathway chaperone